MQSSFMSHVSVKKKLNFNLIRTSECVRPCHPYASATQDTQTTMAISFKLGSEHHAHSQNSRLMKLHKHVRFLLAGITIISEIETSDLNKPGLLLRSSMRGSLRNGDASTNYFSLAAQTVRLNSQTRRIRNCHNYSLERFNSISGNFQIRKVMGFSR